VVITTRGSSHLVISLIPTRGFNPLRDAERKKSLSRYIGEALWVMYWFEVGVERG
jgi:hypothetical protein